jgi:hypothetical protein
VDRHVVGGPAKDEAVAGDEKLLLGQGDEGIPHRVVTVLDRIAGAFYESVRSQVAGNAGCNVH